MNILQLYPHTNNELYDKELIQWSFKKKTIVFIA